MFRSFALYASLRARHPQTSTTAVRSPSQSMLTIAPATSQPQSDNATHQLLPAVKHSSLTCFTARLLGAAVSLHLAHAHAFSTAANGAVGHQQAAGQGQSGSCTVQARCMHTGKQRSSCSVMVVLVKHTCTLSQKLKLPREACSPVNCLHFGTTARRHCVLCNT